MPRILFLSLLVTLLAVSACNREEAIRGKAFIPRETFVDVLVDLHLVDGITNDRKFYRRYENVDSIDLLGPILDKYQVTKQMFDTTMVTYSRHPDLFDQVYNEVIMKLDMMLDELDEEEKEVADSLSTEASLPAPR